MEKVKHEHVMGDVTVTVELPAGMPKPHVVSLRWKASDADDFERLAGMVGGLEGLNLPSRRSEYEQAAFKSEGALSVSIEEPKRERDPDEQPHPFFSQFANRLAQEEVETHG